MLPYQPWTTTRCHAVVGSATRSVRVGSRAPLTRGRPLSPGRRGGGGSYRPASSRSRVTTSRYGLTERSNSMTEKLLSATIRRSGSGRSAAAPGVGQRLVPPAAALGVAFGRRQDGQERQRPDAASPGNGRKQHDAEPAQTARLDEVTVTGADRVPVDTARLDLRSPAALDRIVDDDRPVPDKGRDQQVQQPLGDASGRAVLSTR
jgi:hypothetical protein